MRKIIVLIIILILVTGICNIFTAAGAIAANTNTVYIDKIITTPSEILSDREIARITEKYEGKNLTLKEIEQIVAEFNHLYAAKNGYITKAYLSPQNIEDGLLKIDLVEARVGQMTIKENNYIKTDYIKRRILFQAGNLVNLSKLEEELSYFNNTNQVKLKAELKPGRDHGLTDLVIKTIEPRRVKTTLFADNGGRQETGIYRLGLSTNIISPTGYGDSLAISAVRGKGLISGSLLYSIPVNTDGTRLAVGYSKNQTNIIDGPLESVDISGGYRDHSLSFTHPIKVKPDNQRELSLEIHKKISGNYFSEAELLSSEVNTVAARINSQKIKDNWLRVCNNVLTKGYLRSDYGGGFLKYNGDFFWQQLLEDNKILNMKVQLQYSNDKIVASTEQFSLGGYANVKGYDEGLLIGNSGYYLSTELDVPLNDRFTGLMGFYHGGVFPYKGDDEGKDTEDYLTSISIGANINLNQNTLLKVIIAKPISNHQENEKHKIHYNLQWNF